VNRSAFFLALFAPILAWAQTTITACRPKLTWGQPTPLCNGQCPNPECDYMAPPWHAGEGHTETQPMVQYVGNPRDWSPLPFSRIVRCPKCRSAFWQDPS